MNTLYELVTCVKCLKEIEKIDLFPNDLCLDCYEKTEESKQEFSLDLLVKSINK